MTIDQFEEWVVKLGSLTNLITSLKYPSRCNPSFLSNEAGL